MKDKIVAIVGASGTGKTSVIRKLANLGYEPLLSYTTRPKRHILEWGHRHITEAKIITNKGRTTLVEYVEKGEKKVDSVIAYANIYDNLYFATESQVYGKGIVLYIVDKSGLKELEEYIERTGMFELYSIFLEASKEVREERLWTRESLPGEIEDRIRRDDEMFRDVKTDYIVNAEGDLYATCEEMLKVLEEIKYGEE